MKTNNFISKSMYVRGLQCLKSLYLYRHHPELRVVEESTEAIFETGHKVGKIAQQLFPGGTDCGLEITGDISKSLKFTEEAIKSGEKIIYEAAFQYNGMLAFADIIVKENGKCFILEVKSSTSVKDYQINDVTLQYYVINGAGIPIKDFRIIFINNEYVREGELDIMKLFAADKVLDVVKSKQNEIMPNIREFQKVLNSANPPDVEIGPHCFDPFDCDFCEHCWKRIPEYSVFDLSRIGNKAYDLYGKGIVKIKDLPKGYPLSDNQKIEVDCYINNKTHINSAGISRFIRDLKYPLYFLDFETIQPAIPLWDKSRPYQQIPFQYSLHFKETKNSKPEHFEFLADGQSDPRKPLIKRLLKDTRGKGSIIVYNMTFEKARLNEIARDFPEYRENIEKIISRLIDMMVPFKSKHYYKPEMQSSASLKYVLPAINPKFSYDNLEIQEGTTASLEFERMMSCGDAKEINNIRKNLLTYCKQDTLALTAILEILERTQ